MDDSTKKLLNETYRISQENHILLKKIDRRQRYSTYWRVFLFILAVGSALGVYYYFQPYVDQVIDILGLMGDAVDNIPGIPGVGEKTAAKLLKEYDTLEGVLANADKIKGAMGEKVRAGKESAIMSKKLATIITNVPVQFHEEDYKLSEKNIPALTEIFNLLEFK